MVRSAALLALSLLALAAPARADYVLPPATERLLLRAEAWSLEGERLTLTEGERTFTLRVDPFWLADRVASDAICTGRHEAVVRAYLDDLRARTRTVRVCEAHGDRRVAVARQVPVPLWVEVVRVGDGERFVAGLWEAHGPEAAYARAAERGCRLLGLPAAEVRALGAEAHAARVDALSADGWRRLGEPAPAAPAPAAPGR